MSMDKKKVWDAPTEDSPAPVLVLYNSLTDSKVPFVPSGELGPRVASWYTCGPTVYASAHLGHARNYLTFDIVRRVLEDHFQYTIRYIMNITDVEDKIILRARRNYLMDSYRAENHTFEQVCLRGEAQGGAGMRTRTFARRIIFLRNVSISARIINM